MYYLNIVLLTCVNFITLSPVYSDVQLQEINTETEHLIGVSKRTEDDLITETAEEYERRRAIASNYLDTLENLKQEWIDPYDMMGFPVRSLKEELVVKTTIPKPPIPTGDKVSSSDAIGEKVFTSTTANSVETLSVSNERKGTCALDNIYFSRWMKKLLLRIEKEADMETTSISFSLDSTMLSNLKEMSTAKSFEISMLDEMLSNLLAQAVITRREGYNWAGVYAYYTDIFWVIVYVLSIAVIMYTLYRCYMHRPRLTLLCCGIAISVFWHWMHLYQQKKAQKHAELSSMQIPTQCKKHDLGLFEHIQEYIKSYFATNECGKYYEALLVDPFWEVSFSVAVSEAVTAFLFQPLSASSRALNSAIKQLFDGLPIYLAVFLIILIFLLTIMLCNYKIRSPFFLVGIEPCPRNTGSRVEELQNSTPLSELTGTVHSAAAGIQTACVEAIDEDSNRRTSLTQASESCRTKSVEYIFEGEAGTSRKRIDSQTSKCIGISNSHCFASSVNGKTVSGEEFAAQSSYFNSSTSKCDKYMYSETEVKVSVKNNTESSDKVTLPFQTNTECQTPMIGFEATSKHDLDMQENSEKDAKNVVDLKSTQLHSNDEGLLLDVNEELESNNLPGSLSDSFEILPTPHCDNNYSGSSKGTAGPNCDTSKDILHEMHKGCKFCN